MGFRLVCPCDSFLVFLSGVPEALQLRQVGPELISVTCLLSPPTLHYLVIYAPCLPPEASSSADSLPPTALTTSLKLLVLVVPSVCLVPPVVPGCSRPYVASATPVNILNCCV